MPTANKAGVTSMYWWMSKQSEQKGRMYSPDISEHTPALYRLAKELGKPMTDVAKDIIAYGLEHREQVFNEAPESCAEEQREYQQEK